MKNYFSTQKILDKVIIGGYYKCGGLMCLSLRKARLAGEISWLQEFLVRRKIMRYLRTTGSVALCHALYRSKLPLSGKDLMAVYTDWHNRPKLMRRR